MLVTFLGVEKKKTILSFVNDSLPIVFNVEDNMDFVIDDATTRVDCSINFRFFGQTTDGDEVHVGECTKLFDTADHAVSRSIALSRSIANSDVRIGKLSMIVYYYPDAVEKRVFEEIERATAVSFRPMGDVNKEYSFLRSRRLNWSKNMKSSWDKRLETYLDGDPGVRLKESNGEGKIYKRIIGKKPDAKVMNSKNNKAILRPSKPCSMLSNGCRETYMDVGFIGAKWPKKRLIERRNKPHQKPRKAKTDTCLSEKAKKRLSSSVGTRLPHPPVKSSIRAIKILKVLAEDKGRPKRPEVDCEKRIKIKTKKKRAISSESKKGNKVKTRTSVFKIAANSKDFKV